MVFLPDLPGLPHHTVTLYCLPFAQARISGIVLSSSFSPGPRAIHSKLGRLSFQSKSRIQPSSHCSVNTLVQATVPSPLGSCERPQAMSLPLPTVHPFSTDRPAQEESSGRRARWGTNHEPQAMISGLDSLFSWSVGPVWPVKPPLALLMGPELLGPVCKVSAQMRSSHLHGNAEGGFSLLSQIMAPSA